MNNKSSLFINGLELELFLGWPNEERMRKQIVTLDIDITYPAVPRACLSDDLKDTICYRELIEKLRAKIGDHKFHLIEHVTQEVYNAINTMLPTGCLISVSLTKHPQIQGLGGVTFNFRDNE